MLRIKDPLKSLHFYTKYLGMSLLHKVDSPSMKFSQYYLGYESIEDMPEEPSKKGAWMFSRNAILELMHNWRAEKDEKPYHNGNTKPLGFGHIGIAVQDLDAACKRFKDLGVRFTEPPDVDEEGRYTSCKLKGQVYIEDPDGYLIEIFSPHRMASILKASGQEVPGQKPSDDEASPM